MQVEDSDPLEVPGDDELDNEWFTSVMAPATDGAQVVEARFEPMTTAEVGWFGRLFRAHLRYDRRGAGPTTVVIKRDPDDDFVRDVGFDLGFFGREVNFYRELASIVPLRVPVCHHAAIDAGTRRYIIVLEDLGDGRFGDQEIGCQADELRILIGDLAALHAWGASIPPVGWAAESAKQIGPVFGDYDATFSAFDALTRGTVPDRALRIGTALGSKLDGIYSALDALPATLTHADFRLDNVVFDLDTRPIVYDWQSTSLTPGALDLASLIVLSFEPGVRRTLEAPSIELYRAELARHGHSVDEDELRHAYGLAVLHFFLLAVGALTASPTRRTLLTWSRRVSHALAELDLDDLIARS